MHRLLDSVKQTPTGENLGEFINQVPGFPLRVHLESALATFPRCAVTGILVFIAKPASEGLKEHIKGSSRRATAEVAPKLSSRPLLQDGLKGLLAHTPATDILVSEGPALLVFLHPLGLRSTHETGHYRLSGNLPSSRGCSAAEERETVSQGAGSGIFHIPTKVCLGFAGSLSMSHEIAPTADSQPFVDGT